MQHILEQDRTQEEAARKAAADAIDLAARMEEAARSKERPPPAKGMLVIHGFNLEDIEKDFARFRYLFVKGVSSALDIPSGCVEILDVTQGSIRLEFRLHASPAGRGDRRDGAELMAALQEQLVSASSHFRRGKFAEYAASAELWRDGNLNPQPLLGSRRPVLCDAEVQAADWDFLVTQAWALTENEMEKCEAAEAVLRATNDELARVESAIADLQRAEEQRRMDLQRRKEEETMQRTVKEQCRAAAEAEARRKAEEEEARRKKERQEEEERRAASEAEAQQTAAEEEARLKREEQELAEMQQRRAEEERERQRREEEERQERERAMHEEEEQRRQREELGKRPCEETLLAQQRCAEVTLQVAPSTCSSLFFRPDVPLSTSGVHLLTFL